MKYLMIATALALSLCVTLLLASCGHGGATADAANEAAAAPKKEIVPIALGKSAGETGVTVTIASVKQVSQIGTEGLGPKAGAGETFVVVRYTIKNTGTKPLSSSDRPSLELIDGSGQTYSEDTQAGVLEAALNDDIQDSNGDLNPKVTAKATAVWKIEKASFDVKTWRLAASFGGLSAAFDKAARWPLNPDAAPPTLFALQ